jgi:hypothetical protein
VEQFGDTIELVLELHISQNEPALLGVISVTPHVCKTIFDLQYYIKVNSKRWWRFQISLEKAKLVLEHRSYIEATSLTEMDIGNELQYQSGRERNLICGRKAVLRIKIMPGY